MRLSIWTALAGLMFAAAVASPGGFARAPAHAQDAEEQSPRPLVYSGDGLRVTVTAYDPESGTLSGTLVLGETSRTFVARRRTNRHGDEVFVGTATGAGDDVRVRIREENATVAEVRLDGTSYRVVRTTKPVDDEPTPPEEPPSTADAEGPVRGGPPAAPSQVDAGARDTIVMRLHTVRDPGTRNIESHSVLAPKGWTIDGHAWWPGSGFFKILPSQDIKVTAPDGRRVHIGPTIAATDFQPSDYAATQLGSKRPEEGTASDGYPVVYMPQSLEEWKPFLAERGIRATYPGATEVTVDTVVVVPELTRIVQKNIAPVKRQNEEQNRHSRAMGAGTHLFTDGVVLAATGRYELDGHAYEQLMVLGVIHSGLDSQVGRQIWWTLEPNVSFRARAGRLEASMPLLLAISYSLRMTPQWAKMKAEHAAKMNQIAAEGARDRARILADHNREIHRIITEGHREREAIRDETHRKVVTSIRGVEDYTAPGSGTSVQLPNQYERVFTNGNGEYILTDDASYDPNTDPAVNALEWETMNPVR